MPKYPNLGLRGGFGTPREPPKLVPFERANLNIFLAVSGERLGSFLGAVLGRLEEGRRVRRGPGEGVGGGLLFNIYSNIY